MKKCLILLLFVIVSTASYGQKGRGYVGGNLHLGIEMAIPSGLEAQPGIRFKYGYEVVRRLYVEPSFNILFPDNANVWDLNLDLHYKFYLGARFNIYPIVGFKMASYKYSAYGYTSPTEWGYGANFGIGLGYDITDRWFVMMDVKYSTVELEWQEAGLGFGFGYRF
ncbi:MAG: porin family protein [Rikenellaceae bacterium]|nr:porin family protein [Rikenellaceae bacterium]